MKIKLIFVLIIILSLVSCSENIDLMSDKQEERSEDLEVLEHDMNIVESTKILKESKIDFSDYKGDFDFISGYSNIISGYSNKKNEIINFDKDGKVDNIIELKNKYTVSYFTQTGLNEYLIANFIKDGSEKGVNIIYIKDGKETILYDYLKNNSESLKYIIRKIIKIDDVLFVLDLKNHLTRIENNQVEPFPTDEIPLDICFSQKKYYILTKEKIYIYDATTNKLVEKLGVSELEARNIYSNNESIFFLGSKGLYRSNDSKSFEKISIKNGHFSRYIENYLVLDSKKIVLKDLNEMLFYDIVENNLSNSEDVTITIGINSDINQFDRVIKSLDFDDIKIDFKYYDGLSNEEYSTKLSSDFLTGSAPDIIITNGSNRLYDYIQSGLFIDLLSLANKDKDFNINLYEDSIIEACKINNKLFTFPIDIFPNYVEYNEALLKKLGYSVDENTNWNDIYNIYTSINKDLSNPTYHIGFNEKGLEDQFYKGYYSSFFSNDINEFINYDTDTSSFDTSEFKEMLNKMKVIYNAFINSNMGINEIFSELDNRFGNTKLDNHFMYINDVQNGYTYSEMYDKGSLIFPMLKGFKSDKRTLWNFFGIYISINSNCKDLESAWKVLKVLVSYDSEYILSQLGRSGGEMLYSNFGILKKANEDKIKKLKTYYNSEDYAEYIRKTKNNEYDQRNYTNEDMKADDVISLFNGILRSDQKANFKVVLMIL